jgi:methylmalonyl-CoA mutase
MDPEYTVIGRVARRIWSVALREKYGASLRSQMLKYHIQTSGRSLHSQDIQFNDIRTTLQALCAIYDNCPEPAHQCLRRGHHHPHRRSRCAAPWPSS